MGVDIVPISTGSWRSKGTVGYGSFSEGWCLCRRAGSFICHSTQVAMPLGL